MARKTPHAEHDEPTLGCLDCAQRWPGRYRLRAVNEALRILEASRPAPPITDRLEDFRWQFTADRNTLNCGWGRPDDPCLVCRADFAALPWWRRTWARITGRR